MSVFLIECNVRKNAYSYFLPLPPSGIKAFDMHRRYLYIVDEKAAAAHLPLNNPCCKNPPILASSEKTFDVRTAQYSFDIHMAAQHQIWPLGATSLQTFGWYQQLEAIPGGMIQVLGAHMRIIAPLPVCRFLAHISISCHLPSLQRSHP